MRELAVEVLSAVVYAVAAGLLTVVGTAAEYTSFQYVTTGGETMVAVWLAVFGGIMLYAGITVGRRKALASLASLAG
ncbi:MULTISPECIES: hypothetical protein [Saliphagus]|uniref:DUF8151 domain-containing protein n=1 Tax=Saliphagus infecundisoli TaxID=1849069 RepID=A0ABD5QJN6_9EURY|nr:MULTISPECIES: hypothetical protein [Saliphagus]